MLALFALFIVVPIVEIYVAIQVGHAIGALNTIGLLVLFSICGAWLAKHEGLYVLTRLREQVNARRMPTNELVDGALVLLGGLLLLVPGFVTDACGLVLLFPPTRIGARSLLKRRFRLRVYEIGGPRRPGPPPPDDNVIDV
jgi:UPF0716 protein FxsA